MNEQNESQKDDAAACGSGCGCGAGGAGSCAKWMIGGVVALVAVVLVAALISRTRTANGPAKLQNYEVSPSLTAGGWGAPLMAMSELNQMAGNTEAVFVVVPSSNDARTAAIQGEVSSAAMTITARGTRTGTFLLSPDAPEYAGFVQQLGAPAVLVMCNGLGTVGVHDQEVTQTNLLAAFVTASRP